MVYQNGYWPDSALVAVQGSGANAIRLNEPTAAILRRMQTDAAKAGVKITLVASYRGAAGYRSWATQLDMRAHPSLYSITPGIVSGLPSGHGDANCFDVDGGLTWVKTNGAKYGVTFPLSFDHNHARYDMTTLAGETGALIPQENDYDWSTAMGYGYRLMGMDNLIPKTATNPAGTQLALAEMDPDPLNVAAGHRNVWVEGSLDSRREWVEFFGPIHMITRLDSWNSRSNDPHRISTFPIESSTGLTDDQVKAIAAAIVVPAGVSKADVTDAVTVGANAVIAKIPTKLIP